MNTGPWDSSEYELWIWIHYSYSVSWWIVNTYNYSVFSSNVNTEFQQVFSIQFSIQWILLFVAKLLISLALGSEEILEVNFLLIISNLIQYWWDVSLIFINIAVMEENWGATYLIVNEW